MKKPFSAQKICFKQTLPHWARLLDLTTQYNIVYDAQETYVWIFSGSNCTALHDGGGGGGNLFYSSFTSASTLEAKSRSEELDEVLSYVKQSIAL